MSHTHPEVIQAYGVFMVAWSVLEAAIETAIMKELNIPPEKAQILTTSMQFKQRVNVLCALLESSGRDHSEAIKLLRKIEKDSKRNMLVHGHIIVGTPGQLTFVKSNIVDGYSANRVAFTSADLINHTMRLNEKTERIQNLLGVSDQDMQAIADVGLNASRPIGSNNSFKADSQPLRGRERP